MIIIIIVVVVVVAKSLNLATHLTQVMVKYERLSIKNR